MSRRTVLMYLNRRKHSTARAALDALERKAELAPLYWRLLPDKSVEPCNMSRYLMEFSARQEACDAGGPDPWRVALDELGGPCYVSTVFMGLNTPFFPFYGNGAVYIFETMARIGPRGGDDVTRRYPTYADALAGHNELVAEHARLMEEK